jgi:hypothetical protein
VKNLNKIWQYVLSLYVVLLLCLLYSLRFSIFALLINPLSLVTFVTGIVMLVFVVSAVFVGMSYLKRPHLTKLIYSISAMVLVVAGIVATFIREG